MNNQTNQGEGGGVTEKEIRIMNIAGEDEECKTIADEEREKGYYTKCY